MKAEWTQLNARVEPRWKMEVAKDAASMGKSKEIVVNACLRFVFSSLNKEQRARLYREQPYAGLKKVKEAIRSSLADLASKRELNGKAAA